MLTPPVRRRTLLLALAPCARALPLPTLGAGALLAFAPTLLVLVRGGSGFDGALVVGALVLGATGAFAVDDPAEETLAASPTGLARRRGLRAIAIGLGVTVAAVVLAGIAAGFGAVETEALGRRAAELAATATLAAALAGMAHRRTLPAPAQGGAAGAVLGVLVVAALAHRLHALPALVDSPNHARWWLLAVGSALVAAWTWRDPAR